MADPDSSDPAGGDGALPNTGGPSWWIAPLGVLLVLAGGVLLLVRRRRTS